MTETAAKQAAEKAAARQPKPEAAEPKPEKNSAVPVHASLAVALVAAQGEMPKIGKDAENPHFKSKFMSLDKLMEKTRPILFKHGLAVTQFPFVSELGAPMLRTSLVHVSGQRLEADMPLFMGNQTMQQLGLAITYARRYAWSAVLGVASESDDDGNSVSGQPKYMTDDQRKRLFKIAGEHSVGLDALRDIVHGVTGDESGSTKTLTVDQYERIVAIVEADEVPF